MIRYQDMDPSVTQDSLHPHAVFHEELVLARHFTEHATQPGGLDPCPVSGQVRYEIFFEKWGRAYAFCPQTWSLALASLPSRADLQDYFHTSDLSRLRCTTAYQTQLTARRHQLWRHLADWVEGRVQRYLRKDAVDLIDWGSKASGWSEMLGRAGWVRRLSVVDPLPPVQERDDGGDADLVCLFDVIQRSAEPARLLGEVARRMRPGGLLLASCRSGTGFDVLTLGGASNSIFPFDHVCLPSPEGMRGLLQQSGLELLELTTPGMLDIQLVRAAEQELPRDRYFQRYLLEHGGPEMDERFQLFLQQNNLSSHLRVVARKPREAA
ncbi:MAG: methyltransferase domain-containing protein [Chromatiaceae bacterium]|nr:methyltransferase domain-containing protein [Chromatiaceae bacterium]MCP5313788.1 methyltransferase domain-containing protein [Chromatiaceae bacterium]